MPRYFFDTDDGHRQDRDDTGHDLPDMEAARRTAIDALPDMARDQVPNGDHRTFSVSVRDEAGVVVYEASLVLSGRWTVTLPIAAP